MQALEDRFQMVTVQRDLETGPLKPKAGAQELNALACHINVDHLVLFVFQLGLILGLLFLGILWQTHVAWAISFH